MSGQMSFPSFSLMDLTGPDDRVFFQYNTRCKGEFAAVLLDREYLAFRHQKAPNGGFEVPVWDMPRMSQTVFDHVLTILDREGVKTHHHFDWWHVNFDDHNVSLDYMSGTQAYTYFDRQLEAKTGVRETIILGPTCVPDRNPRKTFAEMLAYLDQNPDITRRPS